MTSTVIQKQRRRLKGVTLWSCAHNDAEYLSRTIRVLKFCERHFEFDEVLLLTHLAPPSAPAHWRVERIPNLTIKEWNRFHMCSVPKKIHTAFAMSVHEDGFPISPELWSDDFMAYDYIGAPWPDGRVGNGGFCMESKKLLDLKLKLSIPVNLAYPSDLCVCHLFRAQLERQGIRFAPTEVALRFSTEILGNTRPSFGFHGRKDCPVKYKTGWDMIASSEAPPVGRTLSPSVPDLGYWPDTAPAIELVYIYPLDGGEVVEEEKPGLVRTEGKYYDLASKFIESYHRFPPEYPHSTVIVCNGAPITEGARRLFGSLPKVKFFEHDNSGYDLGAFIAVAKQSIAALTICFGSYTYLWRKGWMERMVQARLKHGPGVYGSSTSYQEMPHLNTGTFWCDPILLASYPWPVTCNADRYSFEQDKRHPERTFWKFVHSIGKRALFVTWDGEYEWWDWRKPPNIFRRGDQSNMLVWWRFSDHWRDLDARTKVDISFITDNITHAGFDRNGRIMR